MLDAFFPFSRKSLLPSQPLSVERRQCERWLAREAGLYAKSSFDALDQRDGHTFIHGNVWQRAVATGRRVLCISDFYRTARPIHRLGEVDDGAPQGLQLVDEFR